MDSQSPLEAGHVTFLIGPGRQPVSVCLPVVLRTLPRLAAHIRSIGPTNLTEIHLEDANPRGMQLLFRVVHGDALESDVDGDELVQFARETERWALDGTTAYRIAIQYTSAMNEPADAFRVASSIQAAFYLGRSTVLTKVVKFSCLYLPAKNTFSDFLTAPETAALIADWPAPGLLQRADIMRLAAFLDVWQILDTLAGISAEKIVSLYPIMRRERLRPMTRELSLKQIQGGIGQIKEFAAQRNWPDILQHVAEAEQRIRGLVTDSILMALQEQDFYYREYEC